jgi:hypothetical protein
VSKNLVRFATACAAALALTAAAAPASADVVNWTAGSDGDNNFGTSFSGVLADTLSWGGADSSYNEGISGPMAHSHGWPGDQTWTINAVIDGVSQTIFSQFLPAFDHTSLVALGDIHFTKGVVTEIDLGCDNCSGNTFHQFGDATMNLTVTSVPEPASWALMIGGFGMAGAALRRRRAVAIAA